MAPIQHTRFDRPAASDAPVIQVLTAFDLATILKKSVASVRGDLSRAPQRLPPFIRICGGQALWLPDTVLEWLKGHESGQAPPLPPPVPPSPDAAPARRRGRPTKAEQLARSRGKVGGAA